MDPLDRNWHAGALQLSLSSRNQEKADFLRAHKPPAHREGTKYFERPRLTDYDIRVHAWLTDRMVTLCRERHGLWERLRRLLFDNLLVRWL